MKGGIFLWQKETASPAIPVFPMLKTVEQMSKISGIGKINCASLWIVASLNIYKMETVV